jgi:hypothetical protein
MRLLKSDGNGNYTISKATTITLGLALTLLTLAVSMAGYSAAHSQALQDHVRDGNLHWSKAQLDEAYMPRPEICSELRAIRLQLDRIETRLERAEH